MASVLYVASTEWDGRSWIIKAGEKSPSPLSGPEHEGNPRRLIAALTSDDGEQLSGLAAALEERGYSSALGTTQTSNVEYLRRLREIAELVEQDTLLFPGTRSFAFPAARALSGPLTPEQNRLAFLASQYMTTGNKTTRERCGNLLADGIRERVGVVSWGGDAAAALVVAEGNLLLPYFHKLADRHSKLNGIDRCGDEMNLYFASVISDAFPDGKSLPREGVRKPKFLNPWRWNSVGSLDIGGAHPDEISFELRSCLELFNPGTAYELMERYKRFGQLYDRLGEAKK